MLLRRRSRNRYKKGLLAAALAFLIFSSAMPELQAEEPLKVIMNADITGDGDFVIWGSSTLLIEEFTQYVYESEPETLDRFTFVAFGFLDEYLISLQSVLEDPEDPMYPDLIILEPDYARTFVEPGVLLSAADLGITEEEMANMFPYTKEIGSDENGDMTVFSCTVSPSCFQLRADLAEEYLGTTDPVELHEKYFSDWKTMLVTAGKIYRESGGMLTLLPGYIDLLGGLTTFNKDFPWYDAQGNIVSAKKISDFMGFVGAFNQTTPGMTQWGGEWMSAMDGDGVNSLASIAYAGAPWFTSYSLSDTWIGNTIIVEGTVDSIWGGTMLAAPAGCSDTALAADIIRRLTCNTDTMLKVCENSTEVVNNKEALEQAVNLGYGECPYLYGQGQNLYQAYLPLAEKVQGNTINARDRELNSIFSFYLDLYITEGTDDRLALAEEVRDSMAEVVPPN